MKKLILLLTITFGFLPAFLISVPERPIKVLMLIIASDQLPVYLKLQKIWSSYMHSDPEHIEAYFIRGNQDLPTNYEIKDDIIWSKTAEGWIPQSAGILNKTILSIEALLPRLEEFDYVIRTNLSSFYIFPRLLEFLKTLPRKRCYCGSNTGIGSPIGSGCGFIMSRDVAKMLVKHKQHLLDNASAEDDLIIGGFFIRKGLKLILHDRMDFLTLDEWYQKKDTIPSHVFHFRMKHPDHVRLTDEIYVQSQLLQRFYGVTLR